MRIARSAAVVALVAALGLAGCGRKGGLDAPPGAAIPESVASAPNAPPPTGPNGQPLPPPRRTPLDWLID
ncbi:MAG: lipoprotein [Hyphomicrobiales bacterium]|nr:lipoprotein [Hyphomicrobiales bacterium]